MDSGSILRLIGSIAVTLLSIAASLGLYVINIGEQALTSPWAEQAYKEATHVSQNISTNPDIKNQIDQIGQSIRNSFATPSSTETFQTQLPLSPSDAPTIQSSPILVSTAPKSIVQTPSSTPQKTQSPEKTSALPQQPTTQTQTTPPVSQPVSQDVSGLPAPFNTILANTEDAVVNILCTSENGNLVTVSTGSGVIVDPRGIILTNAHVAQDLLFTDPAQPPLKSCTIRQGHLISSLYKASVLYIPLSWAQVNQGLDNTQSPQGTGQGDYALIAITKSATGDSMPNSFPYISPVTSYRNPKNENVLAIGYPAESVQGSIQAGVPEKYADTTIENVFTLGEADADVIQTAVNPVAERGSSGGAIVDKNSDLLGLIVSVENSSISSGAEGLEAINTSYIFQNFSGAGISLATLASNPSAAAQSFASMGVTIRNLVQ